MEGLAPTVSKSSCSVAQHPGAACAVRAGAQPGTVLTRHEPRYRTPGCRASQCLHSMAQYTPQNAACGQLCNPRSTMSGTPGSCALHVPVKANLCRCFCQGRGHTESQGLAQLLFKTPKHPGALHQRQKLLAEPSSSSLSSHHHSPGNVAQQKPIPFPRKNCWETAPAVPGLNEPHCTLPLKHRAAWSCLWEQHQ